VLVKYCINKIN